MGPKFNKQLNMPPQLTKTLLAAGTALALANSACQPSDTGRPASEILENHMDHEGESAEDKRFVSSILKCRKALSCSAICGDVVVTEEGPYNRWTPCDPEETDAKQCGGELLTTQEGGLLMAIDDTRGKCLGAFLVLTKTGSDQAVCERLVRENEEDCTGKLIPDENEAYHCDIDIPKEIIEACEDGEETCRWTPDAFKVTGLKGDVTCSE